MSKQRAKGTRFEGDCVRYLASRGRTVKRTEFSSPNGDLVGDLPITAECKDWGEMRLASWVDQATRSSERTGRPPAVIHKRARKGTAHAYVTMPLEAFIDLLDHLEGRADARVS